MNTKLSSSSAYSDMYLKTLGRKIKALAFMLVLLCSLVNSSKVFAQTNFVGGQDTAGTGSDVATIKGFERLFANTVTVLLELGGIVLFVSLLIAGFKYMTSQGDPKALEAAKGSLTHAITGFVVLVLVFVFLVIIQNITGAQITNFQVKR